MKTFSNYQNEQLTLVQPSIWSRTYELRANNDVLLTMRYISWFSFTVIIEGFGETWEIKRPSIWKGTLEIKKQHAQLPFAKFIPEKWGRGGVFELPNGERLMYTLNVWKGKNEILSQQKIKLIDVRRESLWKSSLKVTIEHESELINRNPWIIMAVYQQILMRRAASHGAA